MRTGPRLTPLALGCFFAAMVAVACASGSRRILLADGSYELKCEGALTTCLMQMERTCKDYGYEVLRATETRDRIGPNDIQTEIVRSTGVARCRKPNALFSSQPAPTPGPLPTEAPPPLPDHAPLPALSAAPPSAPSAAPPAAAPSAAPPVPPTPTAP